MLMYLNTTPDNDILIKSFLKIEGSLMIFVITNFFMLMMIIIFFKETKDKSPKEIEALFS